jgi:sorbitol-specific phosphotransferase system component IIBC
VRNPRRLVVVAAVISLPILFALLGGTHDAGLVIGVVLVLAGVAYGIIGSRAPDDGGER